ncbi:hypothetical protein E4U53_002205 [Claviceps sorghi]|nr:hypothetical protein E4U53_002205 [Claviceps sorghi]
MPNYLQYMRLLPREAEDDDAKSTTLNQERSGDGKPGWSSDGQLLGRVHVFVPRANGRMLGSVG